MENTKTTEREMIGSLEAGKVLLSPLVIRECVTGRGPGSADARIRVGWPGADAEVDFTVESKASFTPQTIQLAIVQSRARAAGDEFPMIQVPYLSPEGLATLEQEKVSGVDLCGNGLITIPNRLFVLRTGQPNRYKDTRPVGNPYKGLSSIVGRTLLTQPAWNSLTALAEAIRSKGIGISLPQASKAVKALAEDTIVAKEAGRIILSNAPRLLDKLGEAWKPEIRRSMSLRLAPNTEIGSRLSSESGLTWAVTGESSAIHRALMSAGGPQRIAVSNLQTAAQLLGGTEERVPNFADVELMETEEPGYFFDTQLDAAGIRWASVIQTWIELQAGDPRQRDVARDLRGRILSEPAHGR